ncbi:DUF817 domain-containing protein [Microbacterium sp. NPDC096154]|uniref:DUF817 domain-containing protein n=1 Tax=Microbacterium sp. NPDC096154 TaxID=3155549 RepID=UPI00332E0532
MSPDPSRPDERRAFTPVEQRIDDWASRRLDALAAGGPGRRALVEFSVFVLKQAWACIFGAAMLGAIVAARLWYPDDAVLARSDALVIAAVTIQILMLVFRLESGRELWVILLFHVVGTVMEIFKTDVGSWSYEGDGVLRIAAVPLYTGFMYAAVGSYMVRVFRLFELRFDRYPPLWATAVVAAGIYANFFSHHYLPDARWVLLALVGLLYARCTMLFRNHRTRPWRRMPVLIAFAGVAFFIWIAENIGTAAGAWIYPDQADGWQLVSLSKLVSWLLLMMISVVLVTFVYRPRAPDAPEERAEEPAFLRRLSG